uniref:PiggyBac transposable element-derived protein 4 C-terminal zinc-finger domain-containing protein n=1 Tax=Octopus bimaculoides TaxID=37653 RepID=A0A0L8HIJ9_OCTBM
MVKGCGHFPQLFPHSAKKTNASKRCTVCKGKGKHKETRYHCSQCDLPLCVAPCFELNHTEVNF